MPTALVSNLDLNNKIKHASKNNCSYKRCYSNDNITKFKKCLSEVKWSEVLDQIDANNDYNMFVNKFQEIHDQCIPLQWCQYWTRSGCSQFGT